MVLDALGFDGGPPRDELVKRLRSGQAWMIRHEEDLVGPDEAAARFVEVLDLWDRMDEEIRSMGFEGCPIGPRGCPEEAPARCRHCGSGGGPSRQESPAAVVPHGGPEGQQRLFPAGRKES